ncbi:MAG: hypothetical protein V7603_5029 [Micromonosporaceae bacterium]
MIPLSVIGAVALGIGVVCWIRKVAPRFTAWCALIVGVALAGWSGKFVSDAVGNATVAANRIGATLIGVGLGTAVVVAAVMWLYLDLRKKGKVSKAAPFVALVVPSLLPVLFVALMTIPALHDATGQVREYYTQLKRG